jgi:hypothetical protein
MSTAIKMFQELIHFVPPNELRLLILSYLPKHIFYLTDIQSVKHYFTIYFKTRLFLHGESDQVLEEAEVFNHYEMICSVKSLQDLKLSSNIRFQLRFVYISSAELNNRYHVHQDINLLHTLTITEHKHIMDIIKSVAFDAFDVLIYYHGPQPGNFQLHEHNPEDRQNNVCFLNTCSHVGYNHQYQITRSHIFHTNGRYSKILYSPQYYVDFEYLADEHSGLLLLAPTIEKALIAKVRNVIHSIDTGNYNSSIEPEYFQDAKYQNQLPSQYAFQRAILNPITMKILVPPQ